MKNTKWSTVGCAVLLASLVALLYGQFLENPIVFDDQTFFLVDGRGKQPIDSYVFNWLELRSLPYATLAWTRAAFGLELINFRIGNLLIHATSVMALFGIAQLILSVTYTPKNRDSLTVLQAATLVAGIYALHPMAVYAVGYLIQRTILMATLFSLLTLLVYAKSLVQEKPLWSWASVPLYYFAVYSKEHAILIVPILAALTVLLCENWKARLKQNALVFVVLFAISFMVLATRLYMFGSMYELDAKELLGQDYGVWAHPLSILTQCGLFFKYLFLWLVPDTSLTSIDMHETFQRSFFSGYAMVIPLFLLWGALSVWLLFQRKAKGIVGFSMLVPWVLFLTELYSVRIQETFVMYRSYLWLCTSFLFIPVAVNGINRKMIGLVSLAVALTFFALGMERLATFSNTMLVWADAKRLAETKPLELGSDRIFYNFGRNLYLNDYIEESEKNVRIALQINPDFQQAHGLLGALFIRQKMWQEAIEQYTVAREIETKLNLGHTSVYLIGRARAYEGAGNGPLAIQDYLEACRINPNFCETLRKSAKPID